MSKNDQQRWDKKWHQFMDVQLETNPLLIRHQELLGGGKALDIACGQGQNAIWLAQHGYRVLGVDISRVALDKALQEAQRLGISERVEFAQVDLDEWQPPRASFDLICVIRFLERALFPAIAQALKPNGLLFYATRHTGYLRKNPTASRHYLLEPGELAVAFQDLEVVCYQEGQEDAEFIARKTGIGAC